MAYQKQDFDDDETLYAYQLELMEDGILEAIEKNGSMDGAVLYTAQTLTDEQKTQARENVGAASAEEVSQALQEASAAFEAINTAINELAAAIPAVDATLSVEGAAADAAIVGERLQEMVLAAAEFDRRTDDLERDVADLTKVAVSIDMSAFESEGKIVETYADGRSETTLFEFDANGNPTKITDSAGNVTVLTW